MDGVYDTIIRANRDLVRSFEYLETDADGNEGAPISLAAYTRLIYNIQTVGPTVAEVLTVDSDDNPTWLFIETPATDGIVKLEVPGSEIDYIPSDTGKWYHELILIDSNGGIITLVEGSVLLKAPAITVS